MRCIFCLDERMPQALFSVHLSGLVATFLVSAITNTRALYRAEPLPPREHVATPPRQRRVRVPAN
jgi:hypothetical protein